MEKGRQMDRNKKNWERESPLIGFMALSGGFFMSRFMKKVRLQRTSKRH